MSQIIKSIAVCDLVLWTENPRDPIDTKATDQDIADLAINSDRRSVWSLDKLFGKMGKRFDSSELPTVAYIKRKPVVLDGNRRVIIGKIINGCVTVDDASFPSFEFPKVIPCNVCDLGTAFEHVYRKHADSGSWKPLERDIFRHKYMKYPKSAFLIIDEATGIISNNDAMNQRFVKEEIFDETTLHKLGFYVSDGVLRTDLKDDKLAHSILSEILTAVQNKEITTRSNRGNIIDLLGRKKILAGVRSQRRGTKRKFAVDKSKATNKVTKRKGKKQHPLFGDPLSLRQGTVSNLYRDLLDLFDHYHGKKVKPYSKDFPMLIRMGLRLVAEYAMVEKGKNNNLEDVLEYYDDAVSRLSKDEKVTLSNQVVKRNKFLELLHVGAHPFTSTNNLEQTIAISLVLGKILEITHGK